MCFFCRVVISVVLLIIWLWVMLIRIVEGFIRFSLCVLINCWVCVFSGIIM